KAPLLLPGILSETDKIKEGSDSPLDAIDPMALEIPRPDRYLATIAIRLAYLSMRRGENERAALYLSRANGHVDRAGVGLDRITYRALNLRLCRSMADLFDACRKRSRDRHVLGGLQREFGDLKDCLDKGYQAGEISEVKFLEWMANIDFSE